MFCFEGGWEEEVDVFSFSLSTSHTAYSDMYKDVKGRRLTNPKATTTTALNTTSGRNNTSLTIIGGNLV